MTAREELFSLVRSIWSMEEISENFVTGIFVTVYKNKGSPNEMDKYRLTCLLNHAYKLLSHYLLKRIGDSMGVFLPETQAGFRKERGTRDNVFILARLIETTIKKGERCVITFIDFIAAFDSVSHLFLDEAMGEAMGVSSSAIKCRAIFRAIYNNAQAKVKAMDFEDEKVYNEAFPIRRGVVQGDIFSPMSFIIALTVIMKRHDKPVVNNSALGMIINSLEYADDAALFDINATQASKRVTLLAKGSVEDADMLISTPKTKVMHAKKALKKVKVSQMDFEEIEKKFKYVCEYCDIQLGKGWLYIRGDGVDMQRDKYTRKSLR